MVIIVSCIASCFQICPGDTRIYTKHTERRTTPTRRTTRRIQNGVLVIEEASSGASVSPTPAFTARSNGLDGWQCSIPWTALIKLH
ncbi:hypothetical protein BO78DRAFT_396865 [Aspergillus sclerotiicarbonarius CBS 121057]|uniref:Uncharacterized protein n=1 Tax=Aspergillus sclerotiicarbonarius (strain CBS 121057 / IBT 28362) TaxID=1448318 RepID=A0A319EA19_ASPSB|nr:hypothetical protein BO78DRAFT_396865 [Aspergillus sclerotiicarbonarius CBS 121057]